MRKPQKGNKLDQKESKQKKTNSGSNTKYNGIKKEYLKSKNKCRVTFKVAKIGNLPINTVSLVGEFNNWDKEDGIMKKNKSGYFTRTLELDPRKEYQFRYVINNFRWENDVKADKYQPNPFGGMNSVVVV